MSTLEAFDGNNELNNDTLLGGGNPRSWDANPRARVAASRIIRDLDAARHERDLARIQARQDAPTEVPQTPEQSGRAQG